MKNRSGEYLTMMEASLLYRVSLSTIKRRVKDGSFRYVRIGRAVRILIESV